MSSLTPCFALLSTPLTKRLIRALPGAKVVHTWTELQSQLHSAEHALVFVDPGMDDESGLHVVRLSRAFPTVAFVPYLELAPQAVKQLVIMFRARVRDAVLFGFDDSLERFAALLRQAQLRQPRPVLDTIIAASIQRLPPPLRRAVREMTLHPQRYRTTEDLAASAGMSTRAVFRHVRAAGLSSARRLVAAARVAQAYVLLSAGGLTVQEVATRSGYSSTDQLGQHLSELVNCNARQIKRGMPAEVFYAALTVSLTAPSEHHSHPVLYARS